MRHMKSMLSVSSLVAVSLVLASCDSGGSAVETRPREAVTIAAVAPPVPLKFTVVETAKPAPVVTANRRETADAKIKRLYERNGAAFGTTSAEDYGDRIKAFTSKPPKGTETVKRANGDTLFYQASTNTFAVTDKNGVPRTMFKPDNGQTYWARQKETAPSFGQYRGQGRSYSSAY